MTSTPQRLNIVALDSNATFGMTGTQPSSRGMRWTREREILNCVSCCRLGKTMLWLCFWINIWTFFWSTKLLVFSSNFFAFSQRPRALALRGVYLRRCWWTTQVRRRVGLRRARLRSVASLARFLLFLSFRSHLFSFTVINCLFFLSCTSCVCGGQIRNPLSVGLAGSWKMIRFCGFWRRVVPHLHQTFSCFYFRNG